MADVDAVEEYLYKNGVLFESDYWDDVNYWKLRLENGNGMREQKIFQCVMIYANRLSPARADNIFQARQYAANLVARKKLQGVYVNQGSAPNPRLALEFSSLVFVTYALAGNSKILQDKYKEKRAMHEEIKFYKDQKMNGVKRAFRNVGTAKPGLTAEELREVSELFKQYGTWMSRDAKERAMNFENAKNLREMADNIKDEKRKYTSEQLNKFRKKVGSSYKKGSAFGIFDEIFTGIMDFLFYNRNGYAIPPSSIGRTLYNALRSIGLAGFAEAAFWTIVVNFAIEALIRILGWVIDCLRENFSVIEEILTYDIFFGYSLDYLGRSVAAFEITDLLDYLYMALLGDAVFEMRQRADTVQSIEETTQVNNTRSYVSQLIRDENAKVGSMMLCIQYDSTTVYRRLTSNYRSVCIEKVSYNRQYEEMTIQFNDKKKSQYVYYGVPFQTVVDFMKIPANILSIGKYFNLNVRNVYEYAKIGGDKFEERPKPTVDQTSGIKINVSGMQDLNAVLEAFAKSRGALYAYVDAKGNLHFVYRR